MRRLPGHDAWPDVRPGSERLGRRASESGGQASLLGPLTKAGAMPLIPQVLILPEGFIDNYTLYWHNGWPETWVLFRQGPAGGGAVEVTTQGERKGKLMSWRGNNRRLYCWGESEGSREREKDRAVRECVRMIGK